MAAAKSKPISSPALEKVRDPHLMEGKGKLEEPRYE
jgi:hypothetical protein